METLDVGDLCGRLFPCDPVIVQQRKLGELIGVSARTIRRWELRQQTIPEPARRLMVLCTSRVIRARLQHMVDCELAEMEE